MKRWIVAALIALALAGVAHRMVVIGNPCDLTSPSHWFVWWWLSCDDGGGAGGGSSGAGN